MLASPGFMAARRSPASFRPVRARDPFPPLRAPPGSLPTGAGADFSVVLFVGSEVNGQGGVVRLVEAVTDTRNRTGAEMRRAFSKHGGHLCELGSVAYLFFFF